MVGGTPWKTQIAVLGVVELHQGEFLPERKLLALGFSGEVVASFEQFVGSGYQ